MKNVIRLEGQDLIDYIKDLWYTEELKEAHDDPESTVSELVHNVAKHPLYFYEPSDELEKSHFSSWWRFIQLRDYDEIKKYKNKAIGDVYYLHELAHVEEMTYMDRESPSWNLWLQKMIDNEFYASVYSEALIYMEYPSLRQHTFDFEIWVDRFLDMGAVLNSEWIYRIRQERYKCMNIPNIDDDIEMNIYGYAIQNVIWGRIWHGNFAKVEKELARFLIERHDLEKFLSEYATDDIPFIQEAQIFQNYLNSKSKALEKEKKYV